MHRFLPILMLIALVLPTGAIAGNGGDFKKFLCAGEEGFPRLEEASFRIVDDTIDLEGDIARLTETVTESGEQEVPSEATLGGDLEVKIHGSKAALLLAVGDGDLSPFLDAGVGEGRGPWAKTDENVNLAATGIQTYRLGAGVGCVLDDRTKLDLGYHYAAEAGGLEAWEALAGDPEPEGEGHNLSLDFRVSF